MSIAFSSKKNNYMHAFSNQRGVSEIVYILLLAPGRARSRPNLVLKIR